MRILILCTGNSCRSQMAEGILRELNPENDIFSAGTRPEKAVNPFAIATMKEIGIDISAAHPKNVNGFLESKFDYVITVCDNAKESCPVFIGEVTSRLHIGFEDPADAVGSDEEKLQVYRKVRDQIKAEFVKFYSGIISSGKG